jgi:two-component system response regulator DegU
MEKPTSLLSAREIEVLSYIAKGKINKEIADLLAISEGTVKQHLFKIYHKIGVNNRVEAAIYYGGLDHDG